MMEHLLILHEPRCFRSRIARENLNKHLISEFSIFLLEIFGDTQLFSSKSGFVKNTVLKVSCKLQIGV